ncbi:MAG: hypothetical protein AB1589_43010 [Cyanobacteriota bacterium]
MPKEFMLRIRLSRRQERKLKWKAYQSGKDMSELIREFIEKMPTPSEEWDESTYRDV